jgi:two-component system CheB/CheR fusion protein
VPSGDFERRLAELRHGEHLCSVGEDGPEQTAMAVSFVTGGLDAGDTCLCLVNERTAGDLFATLAAAGVDVSRAVGRRALLTLDPLDTCARTGTFDPSALIERLEQRIEQALMEGFSGVRVLGMVTGVLGDAGGCDRLIEYEARLNRVVATRPVLALCQYDRRDLRPSTVHDGLRTHPQVIIGGEVCSNPYYEPPDLVLGEGTQADRVDWMIRRLEQKEDERVDRRRVEETLRESEERFAQFMQHLPGLAWIKDLAGRYVYVNDVAMQAFRSPRTEIYGKVDEELFPPETAAQFRENDRRALAEASGLLTYETLEHEDGVVHLSVVSKFPIPGPDGRAALVGGIAVDITDRMRMEEALREADRRKDQFLATLAHELRNPLAPIRNALELMKLAGDDREAVEEARGLMERQLKQMVRLIDDLLDVSRITRDRLELRRRRVSLSEVVQSALEATRGFVDSCGQELTVELPADPIELDADLARLTQVFSNLLNNAAKYTQRGGRVGLTAARDGNEAVVRVRDNGAGIPPEMLPRIFEMFTQVDSSTGRSQGGLGIGLTLARRLIEMHGGKVEAHSDGPGRGSEFVVRLPALAARPAAEPLVPTDAVHKAGRAGHKILVVDDNVDAATTLSRMLSLTGRTVRTAYDGEEALAAAAEFRPDLVLLDIGLPRLNGYDVARHIREQSWGPRMTLVALTGWGQDEDKRRSREAGFDHHLVKPVDPDTLFKLLSELSPAPA